MSRFARLVPIPLGILAVLAFGAVPALAADTVSHNGSGQVTFTDDANEASTLTITANPEEIVITQTGDDMTGSGDGCQAGPATTITCTDSDIDYFNIVLGNMDDTATVDGPLGGNLNGETGVDTLTGSANNTSYQYFFAGPGNDIIDTRNIGPQTGAYATGEQVHGHDGSDRITTGNGRDYVEGDQCCGPYPDAGTDIIATGPGNDYVTPGGGDGDQVNLGEGHDIVRVFGTEPGETLDGGAGFDQAWYATYYTMQDQAADNFSADLATGTITKTNAPSVANAIPGIENLVTDLGADIVNGSDGPNEIDTSSGTELVFPDVAGDGGGGSFPDLGDVVDPKGGPDEVGTGDGDDQIEARDGSQDTIRCGGGTDTVQADQFDIFDGCENTPVTPTRPAGTDTNPPDCQLAGVKGSYARTAFTRGFTARVTCNEAATLLLRIVATLKGGNNLTSKAGDLVLAEKTASAAANQAQGTRLKPSKKLLKRFRKGRGLKVRVVVEARDEFGNSDLVNKRVKVKKAKKAKRKRR